MNKSRAPTSLPFPNKPSTKIGTRSNQALKTLEGPAKGSRKIPIPVQKENLNKEPPVIINRDYIFRLYLPSHINEDKIVKLLEARYQNGKYIINEDDKDVMIEIIGMLQPTEYYVDYVLEFIDNAPNKAFIFWEQEVMDVGKVSIEREIMVNRLEEVGYKGSGKCRFCFNNELSYVLQQVNSGDEPMKVFVRCVKCGKHWKE